MATYEVVEQEVNRLCEQIALSAQKRLASRHQFYQNHHFDSQGGIDCCRFETEFFNHQVQRGVLNAPDGNPPGSPWWRKVNLQLIYYTELASAIDEHQLTVDKLPLPVKKWLKYIKKPNAKQWFRAFNATLMTCANQCRADAMAEDDIEQLYINVVLYRMMFAQAMEEDAAIFGDISDLLTQPVGFTAEMVTLMSHMLPLNYPAVESDKTAILGVEATDGSCDDNDFAEVVEAKLESVGAAILGQGVAVTASQGPKQARYRDLAEQVYILDQEVILPHLQRLYDNIAKWNKVPFVQAWCQNGKPVYPAI